jgi:signal transduction histidine kinase
MDQMIAEYHILRQVICDVMEEDVPLTALEREVIVSSVEQAVNDAATQFGDTLKDLQEKISNTLAHDLRNPLTTAKFSIQMILRDPSDVKGIIEKSNRISLSLDRIDKMITALLDASRLKAGEYLPLEFKELSFDWLAREVAYELNINYNDRFSVESHGSCVGKWNEDGLRRLLENLCTNAIKYGNQNSPIKISLEEDATSLTFNVHNDGEPIPKEEQANLFEKFKRARTSENKIGWGLGLSVVKSMVDAHRGSVSLESHPDSGTVFKIKIPKDPATFSCESDSADCLENHL